MITAERFESITLSITQEGAAASTGAGFIVNATVTMTGDTTGTATFDKTNAETLAAVKAGGWVTCRVKDSFGEGTNILPVILYGSTGSIVFGTAFSGASIQITLGPNDAGDVEITI